MKIRAGLLAVLIAGALSSCGSAASSLSSSAAQQPQKPSSVSSVASVSGVSASSVPTQRSSQLFSCAPDSAPSWSGVGPATLSVSNFGVNATITGTPGNFDGYPDLANATLRISQGHNAWDVGLHFPAKYQPAPLLPQGTVFFSNLLPAALPSGVGGGSPPYLSFPLCVATFGVSGAPVVLVGLTTANAHCCSEVNLYRLSSGSLVSASLDTGNAVVSLVQDRKVLVLETQNAQFDYRFGCYACSSGPVELWSYDGKGFVSVTSVHLGILSSDAKRLYGYYSQMVAAGRSGAGLIAPWAADECLLGAQNRAFSVLTSQFELHGRHGSTAWPAGVTVASMESFLVSEGYCK